jgi:dimethylglycine dehydrogenase
MARPRGDRQKDLLRPALDQTICAIGWCDWPGRSTGAFSRNASARCVNRAPASLAYRRGWLPLSSSSSVGKSLAEWMVLGEPLTDVYGMDIARYGDFASNREYIRQTTGQFYARRFVMSYPSEQLPAGRALRTAPAYDAMTETGCRWGQSWGLEVPLYFAPKGFVEPPTLKRSAAFDIVGAECRAVRDRGGLLDISAFSRYEVTGPKAGEWLDWLMASKLPGPGRVRLAPMLGENGKLKGDLTVFNRGDGTWWITGSYYLRQWHMRWFADHAKPGVEVRDISNAKLGFSLSRPRSRDLLARLTHQDVSHAALPFMGCAVMDVGLTRARVGRLSVAGELGYEIHCPALNHAALRRALIEAGKDLRIAEYGFVAVNSLRLEKSFGIWSAEFTQAYTPSMTTLDRWIAWDKGEFIGSKAALAERDRPAPERVLVTLEIDAADADAAGYEPVWLAGNIVGFITSGGYGHTGAQGRRSLHPEARQENEGRQGFQLLGRQRLPGRNSLLQF